jgi:hypothetical protein
MECVALLALAGVPYKGIAEQIDATEAQITALVRDRKSKVYNSIEAVVRDRVLQKSVKHRYRLMGMMDDAYDAVGNALSANDKRLAAEQAWKLFDNALPEQSARAKAPQGEQPAIGTAIQLNIATELHENTVEAAGKLGELLTRLGEVVGTPDPHTRKGTAALPQAYSLPKENEPEVIDADFSTDADGEEGTS